MQIGFNLPNSGPLSDVGIMTRLASEGEAMGFDYLTLTDHDVLPDTRVPGYPYSESGEFYEDAPTVCAPRPAACAWSLQSLWCRIARRYWRPRCWRRSTC